MNGRLRFCSRSENSSQAASIVTTLSDAVGVNVVLARFRELTEVSELHLESRLGIDLLVAELTRQHGVVVADAPYREILRPSCVTEREHAQRNGGRTTRALHGRR